MRIILLFGKNPNHQALACKISEEFEIGGIVIENRKPTKRKLKDRINEVWDRITFYKIHSPWSSLMKYYTQTFPMWPAVDKLKVEQINEASVIGFIKKKNPDLILVSGIRFLSKDFLAEVLPIAKIMNLHTGISPYVKGGPNCTNWCLANNTFHLIGNTIMWINEGIDTGNIITTERTIFDGEETLKEIHLKVMEHAHDLYIRSVQRIMEAPSDCNNVAQSDIGSGKLYVSKMWNERKKRALLRNIEGKRFRRKVGSLRFQEQVEALKLVKL